MKPLVQLNRLVLFCLAGLACGTAQAGFLEDLACPLFGCADGPAPRFELNCRTLGLTEDPIFKAAAWPTASYHLRGACSNADHSQSVTFEVDGVFSPAEKNPDAPNTSEIVSITSNDNLSPDTRPQGGGAGYRETVIFSAHCDRDPWLNVATCRRIGDDLPDQLRDTWGQLPTKRFPITQGAISAAERYRLKAESNAAFGIEDSSWREKSDSTRLEVPGRDYNETRMTEKSANDGAAKRRLRDADTIRVEVHYPISYGYKDASGLFDPNPNSCGAFQVSPAFGNPDRDRLRPEPTKVAVQPRMRSVNGEYICDYLISELPENQAITVQVRAGTAREPSREAWMGGDNNQPAAGESRTIDDPVRTVMLTAQEPTARLIYTMRYAGRWDAQQSATETVSKSRHPGILDAFPAAAARPEPRVCVYARSAREQGAPTAAALEQQCRAQGGTP